MKVGYSITDTVFNPLRPSSWHGISVTELWQKVLIDLQDQAR